MAWDLTKENLNAFLQAEHHPLTGYLVCLLLALAIQLTGVGLLITIAGGVAGFLLKRDLKALLVTFAAGTTSWLILFAVIYLFHPIASLNAWILLGTMLPAPQITVSLIGGILTGVGGQMGALVAAYLYPPQATQLPPPRPTHPTTQPRRRRKKRKKTHSKY